MTETEDPTTESVKVQSGDEGCSANSFMIKDGVCDEVTNVQRYKNILEIYKALYDTIILRGASMMEGTVV